MATLFSLGVIAVLVFIVVALSAVVSEWIREKFNLYLWNGVKEEQNSYTVDR